MKIIFLIVSFFFVCQLAMADTYLRGGDIIFRGQETIFCQEDGNLSYSECSVQVCNNVKGPSHDPCFHCNNHPAETPAGYRSVKGHGENKPALIKSLTYGSTCYRNLKCKNI